MLADELNQNIFFTDDIDFIYIKPNKNHVSEKLEALINNPKKLIEIGENGRLKLKNMHSYENQISKRLEIIKLFIK